MVRPEVSSTSSSPTPSPHPRCVPARRHVGHLQLPVAADRHPPAHLHLRLRQGPLALPPGQEQDGPARHLLEVRPHRGEAQPVRGRGLRRHGGPHPLHQLLSHPSPPPQNVLPPFPPPLLSSPLRPVRGWRQQRLLPLLPRPRVGVRPRPVRLLHPAPGRGVPLPVWRPVRRAGPGVPDLSLPAALRLRQDHGGHLQGAGGDTLPRGEDAQEALPLPLLLPGE